MRNERGAGNLKTLAATVATFGFLLFSANQPAATSSARHHAQGSPTPQKGDALKGVHVPAAERARPAISNEALTAVVQRYCQVCHNDAMLTGNLSLQGFAVARAHERAATAEKMIVKLRAGMMPPPGMPRPAGDTLLELVETLERVVDREASARPNPGSRSFQRLNRAEYERSVRDLLALDIDAGDYLPLDTKSENFDNIADAQMLSPTLLNAYLNAAAEVSRLAIGDRNATPVQVTYTNSGYLSQRERVEGAPRGTRGGMSVVHNFPADGEYVFIMAFEQTTTGEGFFGQRAWFEEIEVSLNGQSVALLAIDQWMRVFDPDGISLRTSPIFVRAGPQRVTAAFVKRTEGPLEDLIGPHEWSLADRDVGIDAFGLTLLPHLRDLIISGPAKVTAVSETPSRRLVFTCRPTSPAEERPCATEIISHLAREAYRRPVTAADLEGLLSLYESGAAEGGFEIGIRTALQAILASPHFVFRFEDVPAGAKTGANYRLSDVALASRLSFFLWGAPPDDELLALAARGKLSDRRVLEQQARKMLADPRSEALGSRFAAQWLRLQDLDKVHPDSYWFPYYDQQIAEAMRRETELLFNYLVREDRRVLELYTADYTFANERLARHYGIAGVVGDEFQRVQYPDATRRGLFGHGSVLVLTSHANRTSPVLRGKWVMEVLLGTPPPPPPPGVPDLEETAGAKDGRFLTTRERMELHRASPVCSSCHQFMDPIGLALDNFDVTGKWRIRENGIPLDTRGQLYDGTPVQSPQDLQQALLKRPTPLLRTFVDNLMAYALGRGIEYYDKPTVRAIVREAIANDYRMSSFILGVVKSDAFRMQRIEAAAVDAS